MSFCFLIDAYLQALYRLIWQYQYQIVVSFVFSFERRVIREWHFQTWRYKVFGIADQLEYEFHELPDLQY